MVCQWFWYGEALHEHLIYMELFWMCLLLILKLLTLIVLQAAGLLCSVLVANIVQTGLWGKFVAEVSLPIILFMYQ